MFDSLPAKILYDKHKNLVLYSFSGIINSALAVVFGPFIFQKAGISDFGMLTLAVTVFTFFTALMDWGIPTHLLAAYSKSRHNTLSEISNCIFLKICLIVLTGILFGVYFLWYPHPQLTKQLLGILLINLILMGANWEWYLLCKNKYRLIIISRLLYGLVYFSSVLFWYFYLESILWLPACSTLSLFSAAVFIGYKARFIQKIKHLPVFNSRKSIKTFFRLTPIAFSQLLSPLFILSGVLILAKNHISAEQIGAYSVAQKVIFGWLSLIAPAVLYLIPVSDTSKRINFLTVLKYSLPLFILMYLLGLIIIKLFYLIGSDNTEYITISYQVYNILCIGLFILILRVKFASYILKSGFYRDYFIILLISCSPILYILCSASYNLSYVHAAIYASTTEALASFLLIFRYYLLNKIR